MPLSKQQTCHLVIFASFLIILLYHFIPTFSNSEFDKLFTMANAKRQKSEEIEIDTISKYMYDYPSNELGIEKEQLSYLTTPLAAPSSFANLNSAAIKKEDAIEDVNFLFQVLKYSYAGYSYFGGDKTWEKAKNNIINDINLYEQEINTSELEQIILNNLSFVQDGHFTVNFACPLKHYSYYYSEEFEIKEDSTGYYITLDDYNYYIESINNDSNIEAYIKPSINEEGHLCNYIGFLSANDAVNTLEMALKAKDEHKNISVKLRKNNTGFTKKNTNIYSYSKTNDIPVFTIRSFASTADLEAFTESAKQAGTEDIIILDIRGNGGGQDIVPFTWFQNFTGQAPQIQTTTIRLANLINNHITKSAAETLDYESLSEDLKQLYQAELQIANCEENKWYITKEDKKFIRNKTKIFVLMDNKVASSGERFIQYLDTLENVVFIGTNTSGCYLTLQSIQCNLPHSQIAVTYGDSLSIINNYIEGRGFEPDIWIGGNDTLERVEKFINHYN